MDIVSTETGVEKEETMGSEFITEPYDGRINVVSKEMTVFQIMQKIENNNEINLEPDFQRNFVWDYIRQSRLIESMLIRIPLPSFYMDATNDDEWLIIDGLQRMNTLYRFIIKNEFALTGLEFLKDIDGKRFDQLPRNYQRRLEEASLFLYIIRPETPPEAKFTIFRRINTGGMVLNSQEIRHCIYRGKSTELLKKLAVSKDFLKTTDGSILSKRMDDRECIIRFLAFHLASYKKYKKPNFDAFLGQTMQRINTMEYNEIDKIATSFKQSMINAGVVFGNNAFRKMTSKKKQRRNPINKALFETWSVCLEKYSFKILNNNKNKIVERFIYFMNNDMDFVDSISQGTGDVKKVHKRFCTVEKIIEEGIN